jgi:uncharacterized protein (DUF934 family)
MTTRALAFVDPGDDRWQLAPADAPVIPSDGLLLSWPQWLELRARWPQPLAVGVVFPNDGDLAQLLPDLQRLALIALPFPKWTDGRAYSLARTLRVRHRYAGELRAVGDVIPDMAAQLQRTGFDAVALRAGESVEVAARMLNFFGEFYQADMQERRQRFARGAAAGAPS